MRHNSASSTSRPAGGATRLTGFLMAAVLFAGVCAAQTAQVTGRVTDTSGAVIPGAAVKVTSVATSADRIAVTNNEGYYTVPLLQPGEYRISVEQKGFKAALRSGIVLQVDQRAELNFTLEVGAMQEMIEVKADTPRLNTVEASQGQVIENLRIVELPLNGRTYTDLALLSAGTVQPLANSRYGGFSSGGLRDTDNSFILDGLDNNPVEMAAAQRRSEIVQPSIDAIQEFKVQTNAYAAEYGRAMGSTVNVTTKSGSNEIHGTVFEFLRNERLDAKNFFDPPEKKKPPFKRNQYGFSLGGPIYIPRVIDGRNRFFFFGDYEGTKVRESATVISTIPTLRMRAGDFGETLPGRVLLDPRSNQPFAGNVIPANRIDPLARTLIELYPAPQSAALATNYTSQPASNVDVYKGDVRIDANLGTKDNFYWRFSRHDTTNPAPLPLPPPAYGSGVFDYITEGTNTGLNWNRVWTPSLIMSVRAGWNYARFRRDNPAATNGELLNRKYGIRGGNDSIPGAFTTMAITGYRGLGTAGGNPADRNSQNRQVAADATWTRGKHTLKTGLNVLRLQNNIFIVRSEIGGYQFNGRFTRDGMADFLLGMASQYTWNTRLQVDLRGWNTGYFVQDDWKLTPRMTVNLGLRYEVFLPYLDRYDRMGNFDITTDPNVPRLVLAGADGKDRYNRALFATDKNNIMPRVGFALKLNSRTVLRSGYGMFYAGHQQPSGEAEWLVGNPPAAFGVTLTSSATVPAVILQQGPPDGALVLTRATGLSFSSYERHPANSYAQQWNLNIQREVGRDWTAEIGYSGSRGVHIMRRYEANFAPPGPGNVNANRRYQRIEIPGTGVIASPIGHVSGHFHDGNSIYHALVARLEKRFSNGFTVLGSYTFSKSISDTCGDAGAGNATGCGFQDLRDLRAERALANEDIPHRFVTSGVYDLPFGRGARWGAGLPVVARAFLSDWSIGSIVLVASGQPYSVTVAGNPANTGSFAVVNRPNVIGDPRAGERTLARDFNISAFQPNVQYQLGNAGRNILRQRGFFNWDFSVLRDFPINERARIQFRFESFHFTNTPRFDEPGSVVGTPAFGVITSAGTPRNLQFGLKIVW